MSDNVQRTYGGNTGRGSNRGTLLSPRNRRELALFFRIRKATVVTMLVGCAMIVASVCVSLCMFALSTHYAITTNAISAAQSGALGAFGLVTLCALVCTAMMLAEAFRSTRVIHAALNPPSVRSLLEGTQPTAPADPQQQNAVLEHFWRAPGAASVSQPIEQHSAESATNDVHRGRSKEIQYALHTTEKNSQETSDTVVSSDVPSTLTGTGLYPGLQALQSAGAYAVA